MPKDTDSAQKADKGVTDDDLSSALDDAAKGDADDTADQTDDQTDDQIDDDQSDDDQADQVDDESAKKAAHAERSQLGRKVAGLEKDLSQIRDTMSEVLALLQTGGGKAPADKGDEDDLPGENDFLTVKDVQKLIAKTSREASDAQQKYERAYLSTVNKLASGEDEKIHEQIVDEMLKNFNVKHSNNPAVDAELNYNKAARAVYKKLTAAKRANPLKGGKPKMPIGVGGDTTTKAKAKAIPQLDEYAKDFVKQTGMSEESVRKALGA